MPYILVENFNGGLDRRRKISTAPPGTLWELTNAHITRGGEIQKAKAFVSTYSLPADTHGLSSLSGNLYVFGSIAEPSGIPSGITYQRLQHPSASPTSTGMSQIIDAELFDGKLYVIAKFEDDSTFHYYDGNRIPYWDTGTVQGGASSTADIAAELAALVAVDVNYNASIASSVFTVAAAIPGAIFTISGSTTSSAGTISWVTTVPNVESVTEVLAIGSFSITGGSDSAGVNKVTSVSVDSVTVTSGLVNWEVSNEFTAAAVAANITANSSAPNYTATNVGPKIFISAVANSGSSVNGTTVASVVGGDVTTDAPTSMLGGIDAVPGISQVVEFTVGGTWVAGDAYQIVLNGTVFGGSTANFTALVLDKKVYMTTGSILRFCKINGPTEWDESVGEHIGAGFINISNHYSGSGALTGLAVYNNNIAVFARRAIQIWDMDADPESNEKLQTINGTGTRSARAVISYTDSDVLYPSDSGIRTLKPRDSSNTARSSDIGRPIDTLVIAQYATMTSVEIEAMPAIVEPVDGRAWFAMKDKIFVISSFPASGQGNISAWSTYEPGFDVDHMEAVNDRVYVRSGDTIYLYGGANNTTYDSTTVTVQMPFLDAKKPADFKEIQGINIDCEGTWDVQLLVNPKILTEVVHVGSITDMTYIDENIDALGDTTHFAPKLTSSDATEISISNFAVHYVALGAQS